MIPSPVCYLILCHSSSSYVEFLFRSIFNRRDYFLFHVDAKATIELSDFVNTLERQFDNVFQLERIVCSWGGFSLVEAELRGLEWAVSNLQGWTHFLVLSEQHLPLFPAEKIRNSLTPGVSYCQTDDFSSFWPGAKADLEHRFERVYHELRGIGGFGLATRSLPSRFFETLHHGSQWMVLAHNAATVVVEHLGSPFWEDFRLSILADETAIQSLLMNKKEIYGLAIENRNMSFIAWPHLTDNNGLIFNTENYFDAAQKGFLFARKRPEHLPQEILSHISDFPSVKELDMLWDSRPPQMQHAAELCEKKSILIEELSSKICAGVSGAKIDGQTILLDHTVMLNLIVKNKSEDFKFAVHVISYDWETCHVIGVVCNESPSLSPNRIGASEVSVIRVRVPQLFGNYQINIDETDSFIKIKDSNLIIRKVQRLFEQAGC